MPKVGSKTFPYTKEGMKAAKAYARKTGATKIKSPVTKRMLDKLQKEKG
jgi:hypothetical protein